MPPTAPEKITRIVRLCFPIAVYRSLNWHWAPIPINNIYNDILNKATIIYQNKTIRFNPLLTLLQDLKKIVHIPNRLRGNFRHSGQTVRPHRMLFFHGVHRRQILDGPMV